MRGNNFRWVWPVRLLPPIASMGLAPLLDALDIFLAAKVIPVGRFSQPAALTGGFAGATAVRSGTIGLMIGVAVFGSEELLAATAFATICLWTHDSDYGAGRKNLNRPRQRRKKGRRKKLFAKFPKKISRPRKWNSKPPEMPQFHSAADSSRRLPRPSQTKAGKEALIWL